jgi:tetratricopeptide (TPR) repeat protein
MKTQEEFLKEINDNPLNAHGYLDYAFFLYLEIGDKKTAEDQFQLALNHGATDPQIHLGYVKHCLQEQRIEEAHKHMDLAIELDPENLQTWEILPGYWMWGEFTNAKSDDFNPDPLIMQRYEKYYEHALQLQPNSANVHHDYAFFIFWVKKERFGEIPQTIAQFEKAIELEPENVGIYIDFLGLMNLPHNTQYRPRIEQLYKELVEKYPDNNDLLDMYYLYLKSTKHDFDAAEKCLIKMLENTPEDYSIYALYADFLYAIRQDYQKANEMFQVSLQLVKTQNKHTQEYVKMKWVAFQFIWGKLDSALKELRSLKAFTIYKDIQIYIQFLLFTYENSEKERLEALRTIKSLLGDIKRENDLVWDVYDYGIHESNRKVHNHPEPKLLRTLKNVIIGGMHSKKLNRFSTWIHL